MTFQINGNNGRYDGKISDDSVRYGKNAVNNLGQYFQAPVENENFETAPILDFRPTQEAFDNNVEAIEEFIESNDEYLNSLPPLEFEYRYMQVNNGNIDKKALLAASNAEMGGVKELPLEAFEAVYLLDENMTAEPLDINKDGKIDNSEYATTILAADILSKDTLDTKAVNGIINAKGMNAVLAYTLKSNAAAATKLYSSIYNTYNLSAI